MTKFAQYAHYGVGEYWIVDPRKRAVEVYRREAETLKLFTTFLSDEVITTPLLPSFAPAVGSFF